MLMDQLEMVGLASRAHDTVKTFSQGMKQRLGIGIALVHNPQLIILDEPTNGLDPQGIADIRNLILILSREMKKTVIVSSHLLNEIEQIATRILIIDKGRKLVEGTSAELFNDPGKNDIILSFPSEPFIVFGDKNQLTRVFNNILKNAIQAIPEDRIGFIEIDLSTKDNFYKISIKDNGVGISNDQKDRIFVPNFTTKNSGSGLGLAMSKNINKKIGGSISFVSAENEGTIFTILIPSKNEMTKK